MPVMSAISAMPARPGEAVLRAVAAGCALLNAVVHLLLVPEHLAEVPYVGGLFLVGGVALVVAALGLARRNPTPAWVLGALVSAGMVLGFALSRTVGLPGYHEQGWEPPYGILALVTEVTFLVALGAWWGVTAARAPAAPGARPGSSVRNG